MIVKTIQEVHLKACKPTEVAVRLVLTNAHGIAQEYDLSFEEAMALNTFLSRVRLCPPERRGEEEPK